MKHKFKTYIAKTLPLPPPQPTKAASKTLGPLLHNGFREGERIYYISDWTGKETKIWGTVVDYKDGWDDGDNPTIVWAEWENSRSVAWMGTQDVHREGEAQ